MARVPKLHVNEYIGKAFIVNGKVWCNGKHPHTYNYPIKSWETFLNRYYELTKRWDDYTEIVHSENEDVFYLEIRDEAMEIGCQTFGPATIYFFSRWINKHGGKINVPKLNFWTQIKLWIIWKIN